MNLDKALVGTERPLGDARPAVGAVVSAGAVTLVERL
jgi:hypothetical protein